MRIEELKTQYDGKSIEAIQREALTASKTQEAEHEKFISILFYLQHTKRFREAPGYTKRSFSEYIKNTYGMSVQTYEKYRFAYFQYPVESREFGPGMIMKAAARCGRESVGKVLKELKNTSLSIKKVDPKTIDKAIEKYAKPKLAARKSRPSYADLEKELIKEKKKCSELNAIIKERDEQIVRLKQALEDHKNRYRQIGDILPVGSFAAQGNVLQQ